MNNEPIAWINEDELPSNYPYDAMFPYSRVDIVRMFPVYARPEIPDGFALAPIEPTKQIIKTSASSGGLGMDYHEWIGRFHIAWKRVLEELSKND